jgi:hypothetical protein
VYLDFRNNTDELQVLHKELMHILYIGDNRTFKKCLDTLYNNNLITDKIEKLPRNNQPISVRIKHKKTIFTQLPSTVLYKIKDIGHTGLRLLFYYESYINRKNGKEFAYPSQKTIAKDLKYSYTTIDKYNALLVKYKLLKIVVHDFELNGFDKLDKPLFTRYNNHYYVRLENI